VTHCAPVARRAHDQIRKKSAANRVFTPARGCACARVTKKAHAPR